jgi:hypothetical protein
LPHCAVGRACAIDAQCQPTHATWRDDEHRPPLATLALARRATARAAARRASPNRWRCAPCQPWWLGFALWRLCRRRHGAHPHMRFHTHAARPTLAALFARARRAAAVPLTDAYASWPCARGRVRSSSRTHMAAPAASSQRATSGRPSCTPQSRATWRWTAASSVSTGRTRSGTRSRPSTRTAHMPTRRSRRTVPRRRACCRRCEARHVWSPREPVMGGGGHPDPPVGVQLYAVSSFVCGTGSEIR